MSADGDRLRQTLRNLISNATKYSPDGGTVTIAAEIRDGRVRVAVRDQGIGMDEATQRKLFTRFYRADSTATRRIGGTGLGLALVKEIVEAHGGQVGVSSIPGKGSEFWFALPMATDGDGQANSLALRYTTRHAFAPGRDPVGRSDDPVPVDDRRWA